MKQTKADQTIPSSCTDAYPNAGITHTVHQITLLINQPSSLMHPHQTLSTTYLYLNIYLNPMIAIFMLSSTFISIIH